MTDTITFNDEPDLPPVILSKPGVEPKIGGIVWIDKANVERWPFEVRIRDENVDQNLTAHWRVWHELDPLPDFRSDELTAGDQLVRDYTMNLSTDRLRDGECHRLELAVSGSFYRNMTSNPIYFDKVPEGREGDVAYAWWWIWEGDPAAADAQKLLDSCDTLDTSLTAGQPLQPDMELPR